MSQGKAIIIVLVTLIVGFIGGYVLRPVIAPTQQTIAVTNPPSVAPASNEARGTQYFVTHIDEARQVVARCRDGSVRGNECANAEQAVTEAEGRDRFKKFMGH